MTYPVNDYVYEGTLLEKIMCLWGNPHKHGSGGVVYIRSQRLLTEP